MEQFFGLRHTHLSTIISTFQEAIYKVAEPYLTTPSIFMPKFLYYTNLIAVKSQLAMCTCWGFIDGTICWTCRPTYLQKSAYSGHKRVHSIKFQMVTTPDGMIASLFGPVAGSRHNSYMLGESNLLNQLRTMMPNPDPHRVYSLYGDPAYPQNSYIMGGFNNPATLSNKAAWNRWLSSVQIAVEWGFKEIVLVWQYLDFFLQ